DYYCMIWHNNGWLL
nr:immunoglobulin light chain junction region [Macaca mulatta]MOY07775.1 immunoglobulin light chain junction region [Macaca mulatta]